MNKIDFVAFVAVRNANPNGDPLTGNMPRVDRNGRGEISPECIKRKLRNRMADMGMKLCVVSNDRADDGMTSVQERVTAAVGPMGKDAQAYKAAICDAFGDVRLFGGTFAWKDKSKGKDDESGISVSVLGPVSIGLAKSLDPIVIDSMQITKSTNGGQADKRGSDTMGMRHYVEFGMYRIEGSISPQAAERTQLSDVDVEMLRDALVSMFVNDESAARPAGSMEVVKLYWFDHGNRTGNCSSAAAFRSVKAEKRPGVVDPSSVDDYVLSAAAPSGVTLTEYDGM